MVRGYVQQDVDDPAVAGVAGADADGAAVHGGPLPDADQAVPRVVGPRPRLRAAVCPLGDAGVGDPDAYGGGLGGHADLGRGARTGVLEGVGQGLLDDAVHGELYAAAQRVEIAHGPVGDGQARRADPCQQGVQVADARLRAEQPFVVRAVRVRPQDAQDAAEFAHGLPAGVAEEAQGLGGPLVVVGGEGGCAVGEPDHDGEVVADDVVHLAGDPGALGGGGEPDALVAFDLQAGGAVLQCRQVHPADAEGEAEGDGRRGRAQQEEEAEQRMLDLPQEPDREGQFADGHRDRPAQHPQGAVQGQAVQGDEHADAGLLPQVQRPLDEGDRRDHEVRGGRGPAPPPQRDDQGGREGDLDGDRQVAPVLRLAEGAAVPVVGEQVREAEQRHDQHHRGVEQPGWRRSSSCRRCCPCSMRPRTGCQAASNPGDGGSVVPGVVSAAGVARCGLMVLIVLGLGSQGAVVSQVRRPCGPAGTPPPPGPGPPSR